jgi:hypothetical protein
MPRSLKEIFDESLTSARARGLFEGTTNADEADFLGVSPALLSRLKGNKAALTDARIKSIAEKLAGGDESYREQIERELFFSRDEAKPATSSSVSRASLLMSSVEDLFRRISNSDSLLCVDYRDLPQTIDGGEYPTLADEAAKAIANGLHLAMFQPFGSVEERELDLIEAVRSGRPLSGREYLLRLAKSVRTAHQKIKTLAEEIIKKDVNKNTKRGDIILYEAPEILPVTGCGINSRLFFVLGVDEAGRHDKQIYQWVDGRDDDDHFIRRDGNSINKEAVSEQFFPITAHWTKHKKLPKTDGELRDAIKEIESNYSNAGSSKKSSSKKTRSKESEALPWTIYK